MKKQLNQDEDIWNSILLGPSQKTSTIHYAKLVTLFSFPIKTRNIIKLGKHSYIPIIFKPRDPNSVKRKLNRWKKKKMNFRPQEEIINIIKEKFSKSELTLIELPTSRQDVCPLFLISKNSFQLILLTKIPLGPKKRRSLHSRPGFSWSGYYCVVFNLTPRKFWTTLGFWSRNSMQHPWLELDRGLFEYVLLDGLNMADLSRTNWKTKYKGYYFPTLLSFLKNLLTFFEGENKS